VDLEGPPWLEGAVVSMLNYRSGSCAVASFRASYQASEQLAVDMGITNMFDRNYLIEDGYHSAGREYFADVRVRL
jgi:iron complex outermembrane receptor protein